MSDRMALKIAIDLVHVPSQVRLLRSEPLPSDVSMLLRIAAGDEETEATAIALTGRPPELIRRAATFFIEQILFSSDADSYRVLGADSDADASELRRNVALLLRWLHPDLYSRGERPIYVGRVTAAWNNLKTPERRATYDSIHRSSLDGGSKLRSKSGKSRRQGGNTQFAKAGSGRYRFVRSPALMRGKPGFLRRALSVLFHRLP